MNRKKTLKVLTTVAVVAAAVLAWLSGYIVMQIVYDSIAASITFGTIWAIIVFCECRFSYISLKSDGRLTITRLEVRGNMWHIIAAVLIAVLVAIPIELYLFVGERSYSALSLAVHLNALADLFPSQWPSMVGVAAFVIVVFLIPIFTKMASED